MQITMQKIRIEITKTKKTPAKNWNIAFDVVVWNQLFSKKYMDGGVQ